MKKYLLFACTVSMFLISCKQDNPLIDNSSKTWNMLVAVGDKQNIISYIEQPSGSIIKTNII